MSETLKARSRRERDGFFEKYIRGRGIDIGCGTDPLTPDVMKYDRIHGSRDAQMLPEVQDEQFDFVYSSHCLEHLHNPIIGLMNWWRVLKPGGFLIVTVPHRDLYEKRQVLPSRWNDDHKSFWVDLVHEPPCTLGLEQVIYGALPSRECRIEYIKVCSEGHTITDPNIHSDGEYQIEAVVRKL